MMRVLVLMLLLSVAGLHAAPRPHEDGQCEMLQKFLDNRNASSFGMDSVQELSSAASAAAQHNTICGGRCCDRDMEEQLRQQAKDDFHSQIHHHSRSLLGLLATTSDALRETVTMLARQSENKTLTLFNQVYRAMAVQSKPSISNLYQAIVDYVSPPNTAENLQQPLTQEQLHDRFAEFFQKLFPIAYHRAINPMHDVDFTENFKSCLYKTMDEIEPFGDIPKQIGQSLSKSLEATRVLIQALTLGKSVLEKTDGVLFAGTSVQQETCYKALLRMTHCPKCRAVAHDVMPCRGFCTNVMRGCLTEPASELDFAWSEYVETVERLVVAVDGHNDPLALNVEKAVRHLDSRISDAVMHAMEKGPSLEEKVRIVCGRAEWEASSSHVAHFSVPASVAASTRVAGSLMGLDGRQLGAPLAATLAHQSTRPPNQLHAQLGNFLASVVRSRTFYGTLADTICEDYPDKTCWNGERVGEYAKTVVDSSLISQRYNPEFTPLLSASAVGGGGSNLGNKGYTNANTSVLIDQLRHINQMVQSQLMLAPDTSALLADEALEGSGSGDSPVWRGGRPIGPDDTSSDDEDDEDRGDDDGSGSGSGPSVDGDNSLSRSDVDDTQPGGTDTASTILGIPLSTLLLSCIFIYYGV
ncbi:division abnormally delayed protein [Phymastichus coffea]|uniref:division abnormally delayed protein n=1 Tax=Phymastichus coffea TaxID=108790 RepID=UPI00273BB575|nr:division abnormally delayed protein [Phymastichus coffea]